MKQWTQKKIRGLWKRLKPKAKMSKLQRSLRWAMIAVIGMGLGLGFVGFLMVLVFTFTLPSANEIANSNFVQSTEILDRNGELLYAIHGDQNRKSLESIDEISPHLINATIAIEDDQFYSHIGVDFPALGRALLSEVGIGSPRGGSTITQQFIKNAYLTSEHSYTRKLKEMIMAFKVEFKFSKDDILLYYLNVIPYGNNAYGIETASERYFEKSAKDLSLAESAILASIPKAPSRYSPYGDYKYSVVHIDLSAEALGGRQITSELDLESNEYTRGLIGKSFELPGGSSFYIKGRSDLVLDRMLTLGMINEAMHDETSAEVQNIEFVSSRDFTPAPHFVFWVKALLEDKYGAAIVEQGGLKVYTTLDLTLQKNAKEAVEGRQEYNINTYGAYNGALVAVQPQTGQILAMQGSSDWNDFDEPKVSGQVNMTTSLRSPGSSFKPFVYALAFLKEQVAPGTVLYDVRTNFGGYTPNNYDGRFRGPVSIRYALGQSLNIPAIKAYFLAGQEEEIVPFVQSLGFKNTQINGNYGPPLALGTNAVTPLELAQGYSVFANNGTYVPLTPFLKIENAEGEVLEQWEESKLERSEVLDPQVAYLMNDALSDPSVNFGPNMYVDVLDNAAKTGTSDVKVNGTALPQDTWLAAYTPSLVTITWAGNANGDAMKGNASGYSTAAPMWKEFILASLDSIEATQWQVPEGIREIAVSKASGLLPSSNTPSDMIATEPFASFGVPTEVDRSYQTLQIESITNRIATEFSPPEVITEQSFRLYRSLFAERYSYWQTAIDTWVANLEDEEKAPTETAEDIHNARTANNIPEVTITKPSNLSTLELNDRFQDVEIRVDKNGNGIEKVIYYLNEALQYHAEDAPYDGVLRFPINATPGKIYDIEVEVIDVYGYRSRSSIQVKLGEDRGNNGNGNGNNSEESEDESES